MLALVVLMLPELSFSEIPPIGGGNESLSSQLCELRKMFCGGSAVTLVTFPVFLIGLGILSGKLHWSFILIVVVTVGVFVNAEDIANIALRLDGDDRVTCACGGL